MLPLLTQLPLPPLFHHLVSYSHITLDSLIDRLIAVILWQHYYRHLMPFRAIETIADGMGEGQMQQQ